MRDVSSGNNDRHIRGLSSAASSARGSAGGARCSVDADHVRGDEASTDGTGQKNRRAAPSSNHCRQPRIVSMSRERPLRPELQECRLHLVPCDLPDDSSEWDVIASGSLVEGPCETASCLVANYRPRGGRGLVGQRSRSPTAVVPSGPRRVRDGRRGSATIPEAGVKMHVDAVRCAPNDIGTFAGRRLQRFPTRSTMRLICNSVACTGAAMPISVVVAENRR